MQYEFAQRGFFLLVKNCLIVFYSVQTYKGVPLLLMFFSVQGKEYVQL